MMGLRSEMNINFGPWGMYQLSISSNLIKLSMDLKNSVWTEHSQDL